MSGRMPPGNHADSLQGQETAPAREVATTPEIDSQAPPQALFVASHKTIPVTERPRANPRGLWWPINRRHRNGNSR
jgi:hypothetical protein